MKSDLDRTIYFSPDSAYPNLYRWSLQERPQAGGRGDGDQVPWEWSLYFTGVDLALTQSVETGPEAASGPMAVEFLQIRLVPAKEGSRSVQYSMFGTSRAITSLSLTVRAHKEGPPRCRAWGFPQYHTEADESFGAETVEDTLGFELSICDLDFGTLRSAVHLSSDQSLSFAASGVSGFYAAWSPGITTSKIKVLCDQEVLGGPRGQSDGIPRLGAVEKVKLTLSNRFTLASPTAAANCELDAGEAEIETNVNAENVMSPTEGDLRILAGIQSLQIAIGRLRLPMWIIVCFVVLILFSHSR